MEKAQEEKGLRETKQNLAENWWGQKLLSGEGLKCIEGSDPRKKKSVGKRSRLEGED